MYMEERKSFDGRVSQDDAVGMLWHLRSLSKSHHKRKGVLALTSLHTVVFIVSFSLLKVWSKERMKTVFDKSPFFTTFFLLSEFVAQHTL